MFGLGDLALALSIEYANGKKLKKEEKIYLDNALDTVYYRDNQPKSRISRCKDMTSSMACYVDNNNPWALIEEDCYYGSIDYLERSIRAAAKFHEREFIYCYHGSVKYAIEHERRKIFSCEPGSGKTALIYLTKPKTEG